MKMISIAIALAATVGATAAYAQADPVAGKRAFGQCMACHRAEPNEPDMTGPNLSGVYGSKAASRRAKFQYSPALVASKLVWNDANLDAWLTDPAKLVPGTKMEFPGIPRKATRDNVIAYLKTLRK